MQVKSISKVINKKLTEWLDTISDKNLAKEVKDNLLLSGGAITSMFMQVDVNDYDIYIKDVDVLLRLCKYYTDGYNITVLDGRHKATYEQELCNDYGCGTTEEVSSFTKNSYIISIENLKEDQIKLYFDGQAGMSVKDDYLDDCEAPQKYRPVYFSPNAISLSDNIQIVLRFHGDSEQIHKTFDFIHATNYFTFKEGLVTNIKALESILTKQLYYQGSLYPLTSVIRMKKFIKRGWNINAGEILKMLFQVSELDLKDPNVLEEQLIGVDIAYFSTLVTILRGVKKESLTTAYLCEIIDRVFNSADENL